MEAGIYIRMIGAMAVVLGLLFILYLCLKKWGVMVAGRRAGVIEVIETRMILPRRHICLVKVADRVMVLASSEKGFDYLGDVEPDSLFTAVHETQEVHGEASNG